MRFYSGRGDEGKSSVMDGKLTYKDEPIFELLGTLDEVSANLGLAISYSSNAKVSGDIKYIQATLSRLMSYIANGKSSRLDNKFNPAQEVEWLEKKIEDYGAGSVPLQGFVQPGKTTLGAAIDICRTVVRRAERVAVKLLRGSNGLDESVLPYLNRLSSLLFYLRISVDDL